VTSLLKRLPPSIIALLVQLAALLLASFTTHLFNTQFAPILFALICGILAATLSHFVGLARWWLYIQFFFAPLLVLMLALNIPPIIFFIAFVIMLVVYWSTFRTQVPLYLSSKKVWQALETKLPSSQPFTFIDLGSGIGGVLTHLARTNPNGHYHGVEAAPLPFLWSWLRIRFGRHKQCSVHWGSLWNINLSEYDIVFAYLSPVPMNALWRKAKQEMRPGSVFISNTFAVQEIPPQETITVDDLHHSTLYLWHM
jgi:hypothetical protein